MEAEPGVSDGGSLGSVMSASATPDAALERGDQGGQAELSTQCDRADVGLEKSLEMSLGVARLLSRVELLMCFAFWRSGNESLRCATDFFFAICLRGEKKPRPGLCTSRPLEACSCSFEGLSES